MEKPVIIMPAGMRFSDLCLILDFAYTGQAQVPHERLDDFLKMGELLQIRGIKEGRIHFMTNLAVQTAQQTSMTFNNSNNRSIDSSLITSTQESSFETPAAKRPREEDDISVQEASEFMMKLLEGTTDIDVDAQAKTSLTNATGPSPIKPGCVSKFNVKNPVKKIFSKPQSIDLKPLTKTKPAFLCRFCGRALCTQGRISKHESECEDNPNRQTATCDICGFVLKPSSLSNHKRIKHGFGKGLAPVKNNDVPHPLSFKNVITEKIENLPTINGAPVIDDTIIVSPKASELSIADSTHSSPGDASQVKDTPVFLPEKNDIKEELDIVSLREIRSMTQATN